MKANISVFEITDKYIKALRLRSFLMVFFVLVFISLLDLLLGNGSKASANESFYIDLGIALLFGLIVQWIIKRPFDGYKIMTDDDLIIKINKRRDIARLQLSEITHMVKGYNGNIFLYSKNQSPFIVPGYIADIHTLESMLKEKVPVFIGAPYSFYQRHVVKLVYILLIMLFVMLALKNKILITCVGVVLLLGIFFVFGRHYSKLKTHGIAIGKKFFIGPAIIIGFVLFSLVQKLMEQ